MIRKRSRVSSLAYSSTRSPSIGPGQNHSHRVLVRDDRDLPIQFSENFYETCADACSGHQGKAVLPFLAWLKAFESLLRSPPCGQKLLINSDLKKWQFLGVPCQIDVFFWQNRLKNRPHMNGELRNTGICCFNGLTLLWKFATFRHLSCQNRDAIRKAANRPVRQRPRRTPLDRFRVFADRDLASSSK